MYAHGNERQAAYSKMLENCSNYDKDVRHTGALDLCNEICKSADQLEETLEKRICSAFIQHLEDESLEVKSNAVKCIQRISPKIRENHLTMIVTKLITVIVGGQLEALDIFSLTVRGVVNDCGESYAPSLISTLYPHLHRGIENGATQVKEECLDICTEVFKRFGLIILRQPSLVDAAQLMNTVNTQLTGGATLSLRKRASYAMGQFAVILNNAQLARLVQLLLRKIESQQAKSDTVIQVQCLSIIAKSVGTKLAPYLAQIVPILTRLAQQLQSDESVDEDNELSETALSTLETIIRKNPLEASDFVDQLLQQAFKLFEYDPNYAYNDDDDEEMKDDDEDEGWGDSDFSDGDGMPEDDDDSSWRVRRSAVQIIEAVIKTRPDLTKSIIQRYSDKLIDRVKERIDDVKVEILETLNSTIKATIQLKDYSIDMQLRSVSMVARQNSAGNDLKDKQQAVVSALTKAIKSKNLKVRVAAIDTLQSYVNLVQISFDQHFNNVWPELAKTIDDRSSFEPAISALGVLRSLFLSKKPSNTDQMSFTGSVAEITEFLAKAIQHEYSKVVFEGLRVTSSFLAALRSPATGTVDSGFASSVRQLHQIIFDKLGKVNIDTEVKHCCLLTASSLISTSHPILGAQTIDNYFAIFADRMTNELTREAALKGLTMVASNVQQDSENPPVIPISQPQNFLPAFFDLLKKQQRQLRLNTLECLEALTRRYPSQLAASSQQIQNEICSMIDESDLQVANIALKVATNVISAKPEPQAHQAVVASAIQASSSEMIQGNVKDTIQNFFKVAATSGVLDSGAPQMLLNFVNLKSQGAAACLAISIANNQSFSAILGQLWSMIGSQDPNQLIVGALTIGEYGKLVDLSGEARILPTVQTLFNNPQEDVKFAASICMGNVAIGNPDFFVPKVFELVQNSQEAQKYLFLNTIREIIIANSGCLEDQIFSLTGLLITHTTSQSLQIQTIVAEILGRLLADYPEQMYETVAESLKVNDVVRVATTARGVKFAGSKIKDNMIVQLLTKDLVMLSASADVEVKKNALEALTSIIHSQWASMKEILAPEINEILNFALSETKIRTELITEVDMGPFKHKVDNGLPMRKAAFRLLETLQDRANQSIDLSQVVNTILKVGLNDTAEECVTLNLNILAKMSQTSIVQVLSQLDVLVDAFMILFRANLKLISSQQSQERAQNIVRALLRVVYLINASNEISDFPSASFIDFFKNQILQNADSRQIFEKIAASYKTSVQQNFFN